MKNLRQVKDLIKNLAKEKDINAQILLRNYMLERLLERISLSDFKNKFILKGGMLVSSIIGIGMRSTIDMDATIKSSPVTMSSIRSILDSILVVPVDDGVEIKLLSIKEIRLEDKYPGFRVSMEALMESARIPLKIDITTGDIITHKEVVYKYDLLLEDRSIKILAYNIETVIAEKFETVIARGVSNTRVRDFYDIYTLLKIQGHNIDKNILGEAIIATAEKRGTKSILLEGELVLKEVFQSENLLKTWNRYQKQYSYAAHIHWNQIKEAIYEIWKVID
jgi:predicted nucleotidyltransferase component of viral defense system